MKLRKKYRKKSSGIDPQQIKEKKIRNKRFAVFVIVIALVAAYSYLRLSAEGGSAIAKVSDLFNNNIYTVAFFIGFIFVFRKTFRLKDPDFATIAKIGLMLISAYFSYSLLIEKIPPFLAIFGGIAEVLGIQQITSLAVDVFYHKKITIEAKSRYFINAMVILGVFLAISIDIVTSIMQTVSWEGDDIRNQQILEKTLDYKSIKNISEAIKTKARADSMKVAGINTAVEGGNFLNARYLAKSYATDTSFANIDLAKLLEKAEDDSTEDKKGRNELALARVFGDKNAAKANFIFWTIFSISLTFVIVLLEFKENVDQALKEKKQVIYRPKKTDNQNNDENNGKHKPDDSNGKGKLPKGEIVVAKEYEKRPLTESEQKIIDVADEWERKKPSRYKYVWIADQVDKSPAFISQRKKFLKNFYGIEI